MSSQKAPSVTHAWQENQTNEMCIYDGGNALSNCDDSKACELSATELDKRVKLFRLLDKNLTPISFLFDIYKGRYWSAKTICYIVLISLSLLHAYRYGFFSVTGTGSW